jgi:hypothetical protein
VNAFSVKLAIFWRVAATVPIFVTIGRFGWKLSTIRQPVGE